jgi:hypothetical protein
MASTTRMLTNAARVNTIIAYINTDRVISVTPFENIVALGL